MNNIESFFINAVLILFPMLIYEYFIVARQNLKKEKMNILLSISLYISFYLAIYYKKYTALEYQFMSIVIPIVIAYLHHNVKDALLMNLIIFIYSIVSLNYKWYTMLPFFIMFYLIYRIYSTTNKSKLFFLSTNIVLVSLILIANLLHEFSSERLIIVICAIIIYSLTIILTVLGIESAQNIINLHVNLKNFEKEKDLRLSIFKITHEIKNPLAVINGYLSMFDPYDVEKSKRYLGIMNNELNRSLNLLNDFLEFTKIKVNICETDFNVLMDEIKDILIPLFVSKRIGYYFNIEDNLIVNIDGIRMKQVVLNIIKNAIEACSSDVGFVKTSIFKDTTSLIIIVKDNGEGMSKDTMDKITTPFHTTKEYGTGLGVSLSNEIINAHNGSLNYTSEINKGTTCKIVIPLNISNNMDKDSYKGCRLV